MAERDPVAESLADLVARVQQAGDPEAELIDSLVARLTQTDPILAEAIRLCAIPRRLDPTIVGVLRDASDSVETNVRILERLASHPFVLRRDDGSLVYHDDTREAILRAWHTDPEERAYFDGLNARLVLHHLSEQDHGQHLQADLALVSTTLEKANPVRYAEIASEVEGRVTTPLLEALYHATLMGPMTALNLFIEQVDGYLRERRPIVKVLLGAVKHYIDELPFATEDDGWPLWLRYNELVVSSAFGGPPDEHEMGLRELLDRSADDPRLQVWVLDDLSQIASAAGRMKEATDLGRRGLTIAEAAGEEGPGQAVSYLRVASMAAAVGEYDSAIEVVEGLLEVCRRYDLPAYELNARLLLADVQKTRGDDQGAWQALHEALKLARTRQQRNADVNRSVALQAIALVGHTDHMLMDALTAELLGPDSGAKWPTKPEMEYVARLLDGGRLTQAAEAVADLETRLTEGDAGALTGLFARLRVDLCMAAGRPNDAEEVASKFIEGESGSSVAFMDRMILLISRADARCAVGRYAECEADLREVRARCEESGFSLAVSLTTIASAHLAVELGRLAEGADLLEEGRADLGDADSEARGLWHTTHGELLFRRGQWDAAREAFETGAEIYRRSGSLTGEELGSLRSLIELSERDGRAADAANNAERMAELWRHRAEMGAYRPTEDERAAATENARGIAAFCTAAQDRLAAVASASDSFRTASSRAPRIAWYALNLAYACRELEQWDEASQAMEQALDVAPAGQRTPSLVRELVELRIYWARSMVNQGRPTDAVRLLLKTHGDWGGELEPADLAALLLEKGDAQLATVEWSAAEPDYRAALAAAGDSDDPMLTRSAQSRVGLVLVAQGRLAEGLELFHAALVSHSADDNGSRAIPWLDDLWRLPRSTVVARGFADGLRALEHSALTPELRQDLTAARLLWTALSLRTVLRPLNRRPELGDDQQPFPFVGGLTLEADESFFLEAAQTAQVSRSLEMDVPALRTRMRAASGIEVPPVHIRMDQQGTGLYTLSIQTVPYLRGRVELDMSFAPDAAACRSAGLDGPLEQLFGDSREGMWLSPVAGERAVRDGIETWDVHHFLMRQLEAVASRHLDRFVTVDAVAARLSELENGEVDPVHVAQVMRRLAAAGVSVRDVRSIAAAVQHAPREADLLEVVEQVRGALRPRLELNTVLVSELDPTVEQELAEFVRHSNGRTFLAIPHERVAGLQAALRPLASVYAGSVLSVRDASLCQFVQSIVSGVAPSLQVWPRDELVPEPAHT